MFEEKILFHKLFSRFKNLGAIKDKVEGHLFPLFAVFCRFEMAPPVHSEARAAF